MNKHPASETISFRLNAHTAAEARRQAAASGASSVHAHARDLFLSALAERVSEEEREQLREELRELADEVLELRHDLHLLVVRAVAMLTELSFEEVEQVLCSDLPLDGEADA